MYLPVKAGIPKNRGFALIASLTLMMLLGMIAVGILAVGASQNRMAAQTMLQAEARQQALIGLDAAISELQMELGPDQRVTASSGILSDNPDTPQYILGVWNSWHTSLYDRSVQGGGIASTYSEGRRSMFRRWLISSRDPQSLKNLHSVNSLSNRNPGHRICLVGEGTLGKRVDSRSYVYADLLIMPGSGNNEACFAWWVGGENQKVNVSIKDREATDDPVEILRRTWDTPAPRFVESRTLHFLEERAHDAEKILTMASMPLMARHSAEAGQPYYFDATPYSYSLAVNVRDGGLKHDLNLLLNKKSLADTEFAPRSDQDCPLAEGEGLPSGTEAQMPIGSWQVLHAYHNTWPDGTVGSETFSNRIGGTITNPYSLMSGNLVSGQSPKGQKVTYFDNRSMEGSDTAGYARTPVLLNFVGEHGLHVAQNGSNYWLGTIYAPVIQWWNPYNMPIHVPAKKLWLYSLPYRTTCVQAHNNPLSGQGSPGWQPDYILTADDFGISGGGNQVNSYMRDWGNYCVNSEEDQDSDIVLEPGEILVFSMARGQDSMQDAQKGVQANPAGIPFVLGDQPELMHNYFKSSYSNKNASAFTDPTHYRQRLRLEKIGTFKTSGYYSNSASMLRASSALTTMGEVMMSNARYTGDARSPVSGRVAFTVVHGFDGIDNLTFNDPARVDDFVGVQGISPANFSLGWYDGNEVGEDDMVFVKGVEDSCYWTADMVGDTPSYFMAVGVAPKSFNPSYNEAFAPFASKDYRTKVWQHSSPAFWGSALYNPDDQQRQYHPFQLAAVKMGSGLTRGALDTVNSKNGVYGGICAGTGGGEAVSFISVLELPLHPPFSLAGFAGMRLTPGWYDKGAGGNDESIVRNRRMQYQAGVPGVGIGNAFADPCLPANDVYAFHESQINDSLSGNGKIFSDFFDHGLIINDALWDRWFCSSVADVPVRGGKRSAEDILTDFVSGKTPLPVSRYKLSSGPTNQREVIRRIMAEDGWKHIARYLMIEGGFNVNSVSVEAWAATLQGLAGRDLVSNAGGELHKVDKDRDDEVLFSRFMVSTGDHSIDTGDYDVLAGSALVRPRLKMATAWGEVRSLSPESIRMLAQEIVKKVRERGPFLNMSDFINRRLDGGSDTALTGALQAAIDATDINDMFKSAKYNVKAISDGNLYSYPRAEEGSMYTAAPGYLIQSDVLASLGNILTVRDDTFTVRAYGCVRNAQRAILAQAWCEAVVQRTIDYVDPSNAPEDSDRVVNRERNAKSLTEINRVMGRKFRIVSFKWLDIWDI